MFTHNVSIIYYNISKGVQTFILTPSFQHSFSLNEIYVYQLFSK